MTYEAESAALDEEILRLIEGWRFHGQTLDDVAFNDLALRLFAYQARYNAPYARYCKRLGIEQPRSWEEIPATPAAAFKEFAIATFEPKSAALVFETSGTTNGSPGRHSMENRTLYDAALIAGFERFLRPDNEQLRYFNLVPDPAQNPRSSLGYMMRRVAEVHANGRAGWYLRGDGLLVDELLRDLRHAIDANESVCLAATAFALLGLLDEMDQRSLRVTLPQGSRVMETGGFKGRTRTVDRSELYSRAANALGVSQSQIIAEYGMTELTSQYYDVLPHRRKVGPPWLRARVVGPDRKTLPKGEMGSLLHVDLANRSSCIAIQTEDMGVQHDDGLELLGRAQDAPPRGCSLDAEELLPR
jgi:Acyl-protein synthetase, LuxE